MRVLFGIVVAWLLGLWQRHKAFIAKAWADYEIAMATL